MKSSGKIPRSSTANDSVSKKYQTEAAISDAKLIMSMKSAKTILHW